jgi:hypothetical protein
MYKLLSKNEFGQQPLMVKRLSDNAFIPFDPANTDYAQFKKAISEETAQLQNADGKTMTAQAAKDFIKELP